MHWLSRRESQDLCSAIAGFKFARRLCTEYVDPIALPAFVACRLIPLDKQPGVRPIGIYEVLRRIVRKAVLKVVSPDVLRAAGPLQLCAGQDAGCEAAVHALRELFEQAHTDAVLLVDACNAFNCLNRQVALCAIYNINALPFRESWSTATACRVPLCLSTDPHCLLKKEQLKVTRSAWSCSRWPQCP